MPVTVDEIFNLGVKNGLMLSKREFLDEISNKYSIFDGHVTRDGCAMVVLHDVGIKIRLSEYIEEQLQEKKQGKKKRGPSAGQEWSDEEVKNVNAGVYELKRKGRVIYIGFTDDLEGEMNLLEGAINIFTYKFHFTQSLEAARAKRADLISKDRPVTQDTYEKLIRTIKKCRSRFVQAKYQRKE